MGCGGSKSGGDGTVNGPDMKFVTVDTGISEASMPRGPLPPLAVYQSITVAEGSEEGFITAALEYCNLSSEEELALHFQLAQSEEDPKQFVVAEVYSDPLEGPLAHESAAHFPAWETALANHTVAATQDIVFLSTTRW